MYISTSTHLTSLGNCSRSEPPSNISLLMPNESGSPVWIGSYLIGGTNVERGVAKWCLQTESKWGKVSPEVEMNACFAIGREGGDSGLAPFKLL
ncbi:hypothetical protein TNCT_113681 [Trichonephila clavata]|uniref:Uncharacterized protein n=1 Tax=Trichonephila clavata TaxID=2740835 RepID=A0A8X6HRV9_TRICU|nr:hypothetical protein TNCT_113681 [Trichonephila clavata]